MANRDLAEKGVNLRASGEEDERTGKIGGVTASTIGGLYQYAYWASHEYPRHESIRPITRTIDKHEKRCGIAHMRNLIVLYWPLYLLLQIQPNQGTIQLNKPPPLIKIEPGARQSQLDDTTIRVNHRLT